MKVQVLGTGCPKCALLADRVAEAARGIALPIELEKVTDIQQILGFGVLSTPALVVEGTLRFSGKVPDVAELGALLGSVAREEQ
jgi:small redox-active disulfide protein 2